METPRCPKCNCRKTVSIWLVFIGGEYTWKCDCGHTFTTWKI